MCVAVWRREAMKTRDYWELLVKLWKEYTR